MTRIRHPFTVLHQAKQALLLRALDAYSDPAETPEETAAVTEMQIELQRRISARKRRRALMRRG